MTEEAADRRCTAPGHGAFDSWIGSSDVVDAQGAAAGRPTTAPADHEHRIAWSAEAGGEVRQLWERRIGDGPWEVLFDGRYRRAEERDPA